MNTETLGTRPSKDTTIMVRTDGKLKKRILNGADKKGIASMSDYIRMAIIEKLERDGVE